MLNPEKIRKDFPILKRKIRGKPLVFLDSASTSQKPVSVISAVRDFYENYNSNVHRSIYKISEEATEKYEGSREKIKKFLGASGYHIIFTKNCTEAINLVARGWASNNLGRDDSVLSSVMEHHSNIVPWQRLREKGVALEFLDVSDEGKLKLGKLKKETGIVSLTHMSNVLGTVNDVRELAKISHENGSLFMMDGAQSVPHMKLDLRKIGCDFVAFSGHKMLGPTGSGVLAVKKDVADEMDPLLFGSDMIREVTLERTTFADAPLKFETGTPDISAVIGLSAAIDYLSDVGMENIEKHEKMLTAYALDKLGDIEGMKIYGPDVGRGGIVSFNIGDAHSHDIATIVDEDGIAIRSGHHCAQPLMKRFGVTSMARASFYLYNTRGEIDSLAESLQKSRSVLKI